MGYFPTKEAAARAVDDVLRSQPRSAWSPKARINFSLPSTGVDGGGENVEGRRDDDHDHACNKVAGEPTGSSSVVTDHVDRAIEQATISSSSRHMSSLHQTKKMRNEKQNSKKKKRKLKRLADDIANRLLQ